MKWDIFISHASEDKESVVLPLAERLRAAGLTVWLDVIELQLGDSIRETIEHGLANSRFGLVVLSPAFLEKKWTLAELNGLFAREVAGMAKILPIWHDVDQKTLLMVSPVIADRYAISTKIGMPEVVRAIVNAVLSHPAQLGKDIVMKRLVDLVNQGEIDEIKSFLRFHSQMLQHAIGMSNRYGVMEGLELFHLEHSAAMDFSFHKADSDCHRLSVIQLASTTATTVSEIDPAIEAVKSVCCEFQSRERSRYNVRNVARGVIVSGRRDCITLEMKAARGNLGVDNVEVRTYDWLIEAVATYLDRRDIIRQQLPAFLTVAEVLSKEKQEAEREAERVAAAEARRRIPSQMEEIRRRAISQGLASSHEVDNTIYNMNVLDFKRLRGDYRHISRIDFKRR